MKDLTRLYWNTDKERLQHIMTRINNKYLVGLYERMGGISDEGYPNYDDEERMPNTITVKYDGCIFSASRKQLRKELVRRGLILQTDVPNFNHPDGSPKKTGDKEYKDWVRVEYPNGWIRFEKKVKSGKELKEIYEHRGKKK